MRSTVREVSTSDYTFGEPFMGAKANNASVIAVIEPAPALTVDDLTVNFAPDGRSWCARVMAPTNLAGIFAWGASFAECREELARSVWHAVAPFIGYGATVTVMAASATEYPTDVPDCAVTVAYDGTPGVAVEVQHDVNPDGTDFWLATVHVDRGPLLGLFAWGPTFYEARDALADVITGALTAGAPRPRLMVATKRTFSADRLAKASS